MSTGRWLATLLRSGRPKEFINRVNETASAVRFMCEDVVFLQVSKLSDENKGTLQYCYCQKSLFRIPKIDDASRLT